MSSQNIEKATGSTRRYVILPDGITIQNLTYAALKRGINLGDFELQTLKEFADTLLERTGEGKYHLLDDIDIAKQLIRVIVSTSTELEFLERMDLDNKDTLQIVRDEFDEYLRATNDTELHAELDEIARGLKDDFARSVGVSCLATFYSLRDKLGSVTRDQFGDRVLLFRAQLLRLATQSVELTENSMLFNNWEIAVAGIPVLDAAVLRMLVAIGSRPGCILRLFCTPKLYESVKSRLDKVGANYEDKTEGKIEPKLSTNAQAIFWKDIPNKPLLVSAPDKRREILKLAENTHELISKGVKPSEIIVVARDSGKYQTLVESIFPAYAIPFHLQTRQLDAHLSQTQMVASLLRLLSRVADGDLLEWNPLTDPIRLGVCLPGSDRWPMEGRDFVHLEETLARIQGNDKKKSLDDWIGKLRAAKMMAEPQRLALAYFEWVKKAATSVAYASDAISLLRDVLDAYIFNRSVWLRKAMDPRIEHPGRFKLAELHPTKHAERIRTSLRLLEEYLSTAEKAGIIKSVTWNVILKAYTDVILGSNYGLPLHDLSAVRFVDAGNSSFLEARHVFIIGLAADEFPRKHSQGKLLHEGLRKAVSGGNSGKFGYLHLASPSTDYNTDCDYLLTTLMSASDSVTCSMSYLDKSGHIVEWSPFVSHLTKDISPIPPGAWLPPLAGSWKDLSARNPLWMNWRLFSYHQYRRVLTNSDDKISESGISELAESIDPIFFSQHLSPRIDRYVIPPDIIEVSAKEEWFASLSLEKIVGPPYGTHELDLHATCPFQFYFYQMLYLRNFDRIDRVKIPYYYWKLEWAPQRISDVYPSEDTDKSIGDVILNLRARQEDLLLLATDQSLGDFLSRNVNRYEARRIRSSLVAERNLVQQETSEGLQRGWEWIMRGTEVAVENSKKESARILLPAHRLDNLLTSQLIVVYTNSSRSLDPLVTLNDVRGSRIFEKHVEDPIVDYRLASLISYYNNRINIAGALFIGLYGDKRLGYYRGEYIPEHKGRTHAYVEELTVPLAANQSSLRQIFSEEAWERRVEQFREAIVKRSILMTPGESVMYEATPDFEKCTDCVFKSLCHLPRSRGW